MDYSQEQLESLITDVTREFSSHLAKAEESFKLSKSEDFPPKKDESEEKDEKKAAPEAEAKKPMEEEKPADKGVKDQDQQADDKAGKDDQKEPGESKEAPMAAEGQDEGHGYDDEDMAHMQSMYSSMSKPELKAHHDCIRMCMDGMGLAKCEDGMNKSETGDAKEGEHRPNGGPKDGESAQDKTPAASDEQAVNKSEKNVVIDEISLLKSELEAQKAQSAEEKKNLETALQNFLTKFVEKTAPAGKAITSLDIIAKTESAQGDEKPLSKGEIDAKLIAKAKDLSLSKSDRDAINSYYCGSKDIKKVSHLLK